MARAKTATPEAAAFTLADLRAEPAPAVVPPKGFFYSIVSLFRGRMNAPTSMYALLAAAVIVDGRTAAEEAEELDALCHRTKTLSKLDPAAQQRVRAVIEPRLRNGKLGELVDHAAKSLPRKMRLSAFGHASDIIFADRVVLRSEREFLQTLITLLALPQQDAEHMLRAIRLKNNH